ncbi:MAG: hypothetical protein M1161_01965 [Candidatus Thermoplasmatota archaeon]|jgi:hypothetical protein|nr:hypothetical protein [Candidatus Thermoplasmatota archaeon]MCL5874093.1 hypothetical protein [Candidatus Thermoplasmatota archaeon]
MEVNRTPSNQKGIETKKKLRKLNMRKNEEFRFLLGKYLKDLPESVRGSLIGSVYAKAAKNGVLEARDYILVKKNAGVIDDVTSKRLIDLVYDYSTYR